MDFIDGPSSSIKLETDVILEANCIRDDGAQPQGVNDYTAPAIPR
jgi:hypothetical protein